MSIQKKNPKNLKSSKQKTLDSSIYSQKKIGIPKPSNAQKKQIIITEISSTTKEDELALKIDFKLLPSKTAFSKVQADLWFESQKISSVSIRVPQSPLAVDEFEFTPVLDMNGIPAGPHTIKVEMSELWSSAERLCQATKEVTIDYIPKTNQERLVKVPIVKSVAGADLEVVSESQKDVYREIGEAEKKELVSKRDQW
jgi:hypothetical protein